MWHDTTFGYVPYYILVYDILILTMSYSSVLHTPLVSVL